MTWFGTAAESEVRRGGVWGTPSPCLCGTPTKLDVNVGGVWGAARRRHSKPRRGGRPQAGVERSGTPARCEEGDEAPKGRRIKNNHAGHPTVRLACRPVGALPLSCHLAGVALRSTPACGLPSLRDNFRHAPHVSSLRRTYGTQALRSIHHQPFPQLTRVSCFMAGYLTCPYGTSSLSSSLLERYRCGASTIYGCYHSWLRA